MALSTHAEIAESAHEKHVEPARVRAPAGARQRAQDTRYAVLEILNNTNITIRYQIRWGETAAWEKDISLPAGQVWTHGWPYDTPNQNRSPNPHIKFVPGLKGNKARPDAVYKLAAFASPTSNTGGKAYYFDRQTDKATGEPYLDLYEGTPSNPTAVVARKRAGQPRRG